MNEHQFGFRVRQILDRGLTLNPEQLARLKVAREEALVHQRATASGHVLSWAGGFAGGKGDSGAFVSRFLLPAALLILGLLAIHTWQQSQAVHEIEEIDTAVLTGELPLDAYLDKGFDAWLKRSSQ